eukprot:644362-Amphidinium_carterae.1
MGCDPCKGHLPTLASWRPHCCRSHNFASTTALLLLCVTRSAHDASCACSRLHELCPGRQGARERASGVHASELRMDGLEIAEGHWLHLHQ